MAQPGSALAWGASGRPFKSARPDQIHMRKRIKILLSNDDGVNSPGLHLLAKALHASALGGGVRGEIWIVAPDRERNASSHSLTLHKPLRVEKIRARTFSVSGTPTDCVNLAVNEILKDHPALVISGINKGGNLGDDVTYSGTVSAAIEATLLGIPSFAISQVGEKKFHFEGASEFAVKLARLVISTGLPKDTFLNVNVPDLPREKIRGVKVTSLGKRIYDYNTVIVKEDPRGKKYYWIGENRIAWEHGKDTDHQAIEEQMISLTPLHLDFTNYSILVALRPWENILSS